MVSEETTRELIACKRAEVRRKSAAAVDNFFSVDEPQLQLPLTPDTPDETLPLTPDTPADETSAASMNNPSYMSDCQYKPMPGYNHSGAQHGPQISYPMTSAYGTQLNSTASVHPIDVSSAVAQSQQYTSNSWPPANMDDGSYNNGYQSSLLDEFFDLSSKTCAASTADSEVDFISEFFMSKPTLHDLNNEHSDVTGHALTSAQMETSESSSTVNIKQEPGTENTDGFLADFSTVTFQSILDMSKPDLCLNGADTGNSFDCQVRAEQLRARPSCAFQKPIQPQTHQFATVESTRSQTLTTDGRAINLAQSLHHGQLTSHAQPGLTHSAMHALPVNNNVQNSSHSSMPALVRRPNNLKVMRRDAGHRLPPTPPDSQPGSPADDVLMPGAALAAAPPGSGTAPQQQLPSSVNHGYVYTTAAVTDPQLFGNGSSNSTRIGGAGEGAGDLPVILTPVTQRIRKTHPGCTTIKYNRKNNPDLDKRRIHFCDHPGQLSL